MKTYEEVTRTHLVRRMPVIIRLDGKAFHTLTRGMDKPFDEDFTHCMWDTALALCKYVQGTKVAYVQSDEISLLLTDYETLETQPWFDNSIQKMVSVSASIATLAFNRAFENVFGLDALAVFDSRAFNVPKEDVVNYFVWRQKDAIRNSVQALGQAHFSQKQLQDQNCTDIKLMLLQEKNINWENLPGANRHGVCVVKKMSGWEVDCVTPVFTEDRDYINPYVYPPEEIE